MFHLRVHQARRTSSVVWELLCHNALPIRAVLRLDGLLQARDRLRRIQTLRTAARAVHDPVAAVKAHRVVHPREALRCVLVPAVRDPAVHLLQNRRAEVVLRVPPVARAARRAARAQDALVHAIELIPIALRL